MDGIDNSTTSHKIRDPLLQAKASGCHFYRSFPQHLLLLVSSAAWAEPSLASLFKADAVLVKKSERKLYLMKDGEAFKDYRISLGKVPQGAKLFEGDPEEISLSWIDFYRG